MRLFRFCASLRLAVVLLSLLAVVLAWATVLESAHFLGYKSKAVYYGIYETRWFLGLGGLLGLSVLCSSLARLPWKRRHLGFLTTHAGILVLLVGCLMTYRGGIDAELSVFEGQPEWRAYQDAQSIRITESRSDASPQSAAATQTISIPFVAGPFNWSEYQGRCWFPWSLARRDQGVVFDRDGIRLEVLDYDADSVEIAVPRLRLLVQSGAAGDGSLGADAGDLVELAVEADRDPRGPQRAQLAGGQRVVFCLAGSAAETAAFCDSAPKGPLGPQGQLVLHVGGRKFAIPVDRFEQQPRQPLGTTGWEVELLQSIPTLMGVQLQFYRGDDPPRRMILLADRPDLNTQDVEHGLFGVYWLDPQSADGAAEEEAEDGSMKARARRPRIDILQGADRRLYYRAWHAPTIGAIAPLPDDGTVVVAWPGTEQQLRLSVDEFLPSDQPDTQLHPLPFDPQKTPAQKQQQARLRLTVDGNSREFWLAGLAADTSNPQRLPPQYVETVEGRGRQVTVTMPRELVDIGFQVYLRQFQRKLDPGSHMVSHYSSLVDFCDRHDPEKRRRENVLITLNVPVNFSDPQSGRSYRLYQSSFGGPYRPGDPLFQQVVGAAQRRDRLFRSVFSVNYDPGRGAKYFGCLMISAGMLMTFYMRGYLLQGRGRRAAEDREVIG